MWAARCALPRPPDSILAELCQGTRIEDSTLSTNAGDITVFHFVQSTVDGGGQKRIGRRDGQDHFRFSGDSRRIRPASPARAPVVAEGALNGGGPMLRINVIGGTIYLRRQK